MVFKFFRIISAVILFKLSGYALMVLLFLHKIELHLAVKAGGLILLLGNFYFIWQSFRSQNKFPWGLLISAINLGIIGWGVSREFV